MQAVLCDLCDLPIRGSAFELHFIRGEAVSGDGGQTRLVQREGSSMLHLCAPCGEWVQRAMEHLRQGHKEVARLIPTAKDAGRRHAA